MKKKKRYIVILVVLIIYVIVMFLVGEKNNSVKYKNDELTLIIGDNTILQNNEGKWLNITENSTIQDLNWLEYNVYLDNKKLGNYYLWYNEEKWYIFDSNKKAVNEEGNLIAYKANYEIKIKDFTSKDIRNYYNVQKILEENNLDTSSQFTVATETTIDIDSDGNTETLYFVSNAFPLDFNPSKIFSFVFMLKDGQIYKLYNSVENNGVNNGCKPYLSAVLDIDHDDNYELAITCAEYSVMKPTVMLYKLVDDEFKILISNK